LDAGRCERQVRECDEGAERIRLTARYGPYAVFLAAYTVLLAGYSGQPDVVIGVPLANRRGLRQRRSLGYFVNTLPLRIDVDRAGSFAQLRETLATRIFTLLRYQDFDLAAYTEQVLGGRPAGRTRGGGQLGHVLR